MHKISDSTLNPVKHWTFAICRVFAITGAKPEWKFDWFLVGAKVCRITKAFINHLIKKTVKDIIRDKLRFRLEDVANQEVPKSDGMGREPTF